jgi:hypothetical protein
MQTKKHLSESSETRTPKIVENILLSLSSGRLSLVSVINNQNKKVNHSPLLFEPASYMFSKQQNMLY